MAKILLYTIHDYECSGIRMLGAYARTHGHDARLCFLGGESGVTVKTSLAPGECNALSSRSQDLTFIVQSRGRGAVHVNLPEDYYDFTIPEAFLALLRDWQPDIVGYSGRSILTPYFQDWFTRIREAAPAALIIAGGFGPTLESKVYLDRGVDAVVRGEGEGTLVELADRLDKNLPWFDVRNLVFRSREKIFTNPLRPAIRDLDTLPPQLKLCDGIYTVKNGKLETKDPLPAHAISHCFLSRGCVGSCSYCSSGHFRDVYKNNNVSMPKYRYPSNEQCIAQFKELKAKGAKGIVMEDDFFVRPYEVMRDFFARYTKEIGLPFFAYLHPQFLRNHPEMLGEALKAGLSLVDIPIQSADVNLNKKFFMRDTDLATVLWAARYARDRFVPFVTHFIDGFEAHGIDMEEYLQTNLRFIGQLPAFHPGFPRLVSYAVSYLRLHLNSPLMQSGRSRPMPCAVFFRRAMLVFFRHILDDAAFAALEDANEYKESPEPLLDLFNRTRSLLHKAYMTRSAEYLAGREVLLWGTSDGYATRKPLLLGLRPKAFLTGGPVPQRRVDGIPVLPPAEKINALQTAAREHLPILLCVPNAQQQARHIKELLPDFPEQLLYGFGEEG